MMQDKKLREHLLETLSFYEKMSMERIILEFDSELLSESPNWTMDVLRFELDELVIIGLVRTIKENQEVYFLRQMPKKGLQSLIKYLWRRTKANLVAMLSRR
jgi:hypothetical protein